MSNEMPPTEFAAKTWIFKVQALIFGGLGLFSVILGPLFLLGVMLDAHGKPRPDAGIALTISGIVFLCPFALAIFNICARRQAPIRLYQEGIVVRRIGASTLDRIPFVPTLIRLAWLVISLQGFKHDTLVLPWETFRNAFISGMPMESRATTKWYSLWGSA